MLFLKTTLVEPSPQSEKTAARHGNASTNRPILCPTAASLILSRLGTKRVKRLRSLWWRNKGKWCKVGQFDQLVNVRNEGIVGHAVLHSNVCKVCSILWVHFSVQNKGQIGLQDKTCGALNICIARTYERAVGSRWGEIRITGDMFFKIRWHRTYPGCQLKSIVSGVADAKSAHCSPEYHSPRQPRSQIPTRQFQDQSLLLETFVFR